MIHTYIPSGNLTQLLKNGDLYWNYPLKMVIFNSYVSLPEGTKSPTIFPVYSQYIPHDLTNWSQFLTPWTSSLLHCSLQLLAFVTYFILRTVHQASLDVPFGRNIEEMWRYQWKFQDHKIEVPYQINAIFGAYLSLKLHGRA